MQKRLRVPIHGVLLVDKSPGYTSNDVLMRAKRLFHAQKAGHTGTLDPFATGLLPICFGEATKFSQDLLDADKTYETRIHLGITTTTGDTEGEITAEQKVAVDTEKIVAVLSRFRGEIDQIPPMHSALKRDGKPLYEYARAGITLEREARRVIIHALDLLDYAPPFLTLRVRCSKGTYIRVLGEDIGNALGCGAHLNSLRRTIVGELNLQHARSLDDIEAMTETQRLDTLAPVDALLSSFPAVSLTDALAQRFLHGQRLALSKENVALPATSGRIRIYRASDHMLLGTGQLADYGVLAPERLIAGTVTPPASQLRASS